MAAQTPATWDERVPVFDEGDPISGREATIIGEDAMNIFRALSLGLAQTAGLPANATHAQIMEAFMQRVVITGEVKAFAGANAPTGWLVCDGALVSRTTYATLFAAIGVAYGTGDDAITFALPDLRGRVPIGAGEGIGLDIRVLGAKGGDEDAQAHTHYVISHEFTESIHNNIFTNPIYKERTVSEYFNRPAASGVIADTAPSSTAGTGQSGNMPPWAALNYIIKT